jgi:integrase
MAALGWRWKNRKWEKVLPGDQKDTGKLSSVNTNRAHLRRFMLISLSTGSRSGVTMRLMWRPSPVDPWVDLEAGANYRSGKRETVARNKRRPVVKLPHRLCTHLEPWKQLDEQKGIACVINCGRDRVASVRGSFAACIRDAGLTEATPYWRRHTAATWLMETGGDIWEASGYLGMTPEMLTRTYGHHRPDHQESARRAFK